MNTHHIHLHLQAHIYVVCVCMSLTIGQYTHEIATFTRFSECFIFWFHIKIDLDRKQGNICHWEGKTWETAQRRTVYSHHLHRIIYPHKIPYRNCTKLRTSTVIRVGSRTCFQLCISCDLNL